MTDTTYEIRKALAINCFDVYVNGQFVERFDRKYEAQAAIDRFKNITIR